MSKKVILKLGEVIGLQKELNNLLSEKLVLSIKMDIQKLLASVNTIIEDYNIQRKEFFKLHGTEDEKGNYTLPDELSKELTKELQDTLDKEETFTTVLKFDSFKELVSEYPYYIFFKLFE